jgi:uncharacterized protein YjbI with pentapeptide repeats
VLARDPRFDGRFFTAGVRLAGANLQYAYLENANLAGADLTGADLREADTTDAELTDALCRTAPADWTHAPGSVRLMKVAHPTNQP